MKWEPIETAPKDGTPVLLWWNFCGNIPVVGRWYRDSDITIGPTEGWAGEDDSCIPINQHDCTHWMPLPPAPQAQGEIEERSDEVVAEQYKRCLTLIKRLVQKLQSVSRDTHYGIHDGDYYAPYGEKPADWQTEPCGCALCSGLKLLAENEVANDT